ncbi:MAG: metallophosphoesterase [Candidatus Thorarchaeota archaeon]
MDSSRNSISGTGSLTEGLGMRPVKVAAIADVHSPRYLDEFNKALSKCAPPDFFLFAGDMVNRGASEEYLKVLEAIENHLGLNFPIISCLGNEDPTDIKKQTRQLTGERITFLNDSSITIKTSGSRITIVGLSPSTNNLLEARSTSFPEIQSTFEVKTTRLTHLLQDATSSSDHTILLMHFSPLLENNPREFSSWLSNAVTNHPPLYIIHGHVHDATRVKVKIGATTIMNVALPVTGSITKLVL